LCSPLCSRVSTTPGNLLEFKNPPRNLLEFNWSSWKFLYKMSKITALVSSHKNMDKYLAQKYEIYRHQMCSFKFQMHQNPFSAGAPPWTPVWELMTLPQIPIRLGRGHRELGVPSEGGRSKANMSWIFLKIPPGFSWKSPGNLLD